MEDGIYTDDDIHVETGIYGGWHILTQIYMCDGVNVETGIYGGWRIQERWRVY